MGMRRAGVVNTIFGTTNVLASNVKTETGEYSLFFFLSIYSFIHLYRDSVTASTTKCDVQQDTGKTRAGKDTNFCIHFARGKCILVSSCFPLYLACLSSFFNFYIYLLLFLFQGE
jgi:hypothetical protein